MKLSCPFRFRLLLGAAFYATIAVLSASMFGQSPAGKIVFASARDGNNEDLYVMKADGSNVTRLTDDPAADFSPALSADGSKVAFISRRSGDKVRDIFVMSADGSGVVQVTFTPEPGPEDQDVPGPFGPLSPAFDPQCDRLVYTENSALYVVTIVGGAVQLVGTLGEAGITVRETPVFSPDATRIAFSGWTETGTEPGSGIFAINADIYVVNANGSGLTRLTTHPGWDTEPSFSHDGSKIAFARRDDPTAGIYAVKSTGGAATRLTITNSNQFTPHIVSVNPNGTGQRILTNLENDRTLVDGSPAVSPDGTRVAFERQLPGAQFGDEQSDIMLMGADGSDLTNLTQHPANDFEPTFSPDGTKIVFASLRDQSFDLYTLTTTGAAPAKVAGRSPVVQAAAPPAPLAQKLTTGAGDERDADLDRRSVKIPAGVQVSGGKRVVGEGQKAAFFTVHLAAPAKQTISLQYTTEDGTAQAKSDYTGQAGTLSFAPQQRSKTIRVPIINDTLDEDNETFLLKLFSLDGTSAATAQGTILDDDPTPRLSIAPVQVSSPARGTAPAVFVVRLSAPSAHTVTAEFRTKDGRATSPADYTAASGTLTFAPGKTEQSVSVDVNVDSVAERAQTFLLELGSVTNARGQGTRGRATIAERQ